MPTEPYPRVTIGGDDYYQTQTLIPVDQDPDNGVLVYIGTPDGGFLAGATLVKGDGGMPSIIDTDVNITELEPDDATPASADFVEITPGDADTSQVVQLNWTYHKPAAGADGTTSLDLDSVDGTAAAGKFPVLNSSVDGLEWKTPKVGSRKYPATIASTPSGNPSYTLCTVSVGPFDFDWRPRCFGECVITPTSTDVAVDLLARIGSTSGNVIARGMGVANQGPAHKLGPDVTPADITAGGADFDKVTAGSTVTIYFRAERTAGTGTFTTSDTRTSFRVEVEPVP